MKNEKCSSQQVLYEISEVATEVQQPKAPFKIKEKHFSTRKKLLNVTIHIKDLLKTPEESKRFMDILLQQNWKKVRCGANSGKLAEKITR